MIEHKIVNDVYQIEEDGKVVFSVKLDKELDQVIIRTEKEVFAGPVKFLEFATIPELKK